MTTETTFGTMSILELDIYKTIERDLDHKEATIVKVVYLVMSPGGREMVVDVYPTCQDDLLDLPMVNADSSVNVGLVDFDLEPGIRVPVNTVKVSELTW